MGHSSKPALWLLKVHQSLKLKVWSYFEDTTNDVAQLILFFDNNNKKKTLREQTPNHFFHFVHQSSL